MVANEMNTLKPNYLNKITCSTFSSNKNSKPIILEIKMYINTRVLLYIG